MSHPAEVEPDDGRHGVGQLIHGHTHRPARHDGATAALGVGRLGAEGWAMQASKNSLIYIILL